MTALSSGRHARTPPRNAPASRGIGLLVRARNVPAFAAGVGSVALVAWWAADSLVSRPMSAGPIDRVPVAALAPLAIAILVSTTLYAADEELETTAARPWRRIRVVQVVVLTVVGAGAVAMTGLGEPTVYGATELVRNTLGCVGIVVAAAPLLGGRLAWAAAFGYVPIVYFAAPRPLELDTGWWTWPVQLSDSTSAWWACTAWFVIGMAAYARRGSRPRRSDDS